MSKELSTGVATVYVSRSELLEIIGGSGGLEIPEGSTVIFGDFKMTADGELSISLAWDSTDNHPCDWADAPNWVVALGRGQS